MSEDLAGQRIIKIRTDRSQRVPGTASVASQTGPSRSEIGDRNMRLAMTADKKLETPAITQVDSNLITDLDPSNPLFTLKAQLRQDRQPPSKKEPTPEDLDIGEISDE